MQAKLLRAIQEKRVRPVGGDCEIEVDVRILAATNRDLREMVAAAQFRADLYHRLAVLEIRVPPLRERTADLRVLVRSLEPRLAAETGCPLPPISSAAWAALEEYNWPGNVRELHAVLARSVLRAAGEQIVPRHLALRGLPDLSFRSGRMEREMIVAALRGAGDNVSAAARNIGWSRQKLYRRMKVLAINRNASV